MGGLYSIGASALNNAQIDVTTAGHNIANANTPGYSRQVVTQTTNAPSYSGVGFIGQGASVTSIARVYDSFLGNQVRQATNQAAETSGYLANMQTIDNMIGDPSAGLAPALSSFFSGMQAVAASRRTSRRASHCSPAPSRSLRNSTCSTRS